MWHTVRISSLFPALLALAAFGLAAHGQGDTDQPTDESQSAPSALSLDMESLVAAQEVFPGRIDDPVWQIEAQQGRQIIQIPLIVEPADQPLAIDRPTVELRGGRFIAWRITPPDSNARDAAPRLTRDFVVQPDGTLEWDLERAIPGATVKEAREGYALKLRRDLLAAQEPQRPGPINPGGNLRDARDKRRQQEMEYRTKMRTFRELRRQVLDLPEQFNQPLPPRLWAIYEVRETLPELTFVGPDEDELLPWSIRTSNLDILRRVASGRSGGRGGLDGQTASDVAQLANLVRNAHPLTHRAAALALDNAGIVGRAQPNDSLFHLLQAIITGPDAVARQTVVKALAATVPPTGATAALLREATSYVSPELQLMSLRGLFQGNIRDAEQLRQMLANLNRALADEDGPDAGLALDALVEALASQRGSAEANAAIIVAGVDFDSLPPARRDQAIAYVIRAAGTHTIAADWLNHRLLGAADPALAKRTLELLGRAGNGHDAATLKPVATTLMNLISRPSDTSDDPQPANAATPTPSLSGPIPVDSPGHSLFRAINSGDPEIRDLAWRALPHFTLADPRRGRNRDHQAQAGDVTDQLLTAALNRQPTPPSLAAFFAGQPKHPRATRGLIDLVLHADGSAANQAARALLGTGRDLDHALRVLAPAQRAQFAAELYEQLQGRAPLVTGLLANPDDQQVSRWFAQQVAAGELPTPTDWAAQFRDDESLLKLATANEPQLAAAAVAALVAAAGGDRIAAEQLAEQFAAASDRSLAGLTAQWATAKQDIYIRQLERATGTYNLSLHISDAQSQPDAALPPGRAILIGLVELSVDGQSVYLGNRTVNFAIPDDRLALRLTPQDLKNLPNDELAAIPLEEINDTIDLLPQPDGSWRGEAKLPDGKRLTIILQAMSAS